MSRYRDFAYGGPTGYRYEHHKTSGTLIRVDQSNYVAAEGRMVDSVGPRSIDNACIASNLKRQPPLVNGSYESFVSRYTFVDFAEVPPLLNLIHLSVAGDPGFGAAATRGAAMANPSIGKDQISLPVSIAELRELPRMVMSKYRKGGRTRNSVVESEFGWAPMISDIKGLFSFPTLVDLEFERLNALRSYPNSRVSRTRTPWDGYNSAVTNHSNLWKFTKETVIDYRVTSRWRPRDHFKSFSDREMVELSRKLVLSLTPQALIRQAWDILPWTWLIDWFSDFGDFLSLTDNTVAYLSGPTVITRKAKTTVKVHRIEGSYNSALSYKDGVYHNTEWERSINYFLTPNFYVPFLTARQTSILASIAINRFKR